MWRKEALVASTEGVGVTPTRDKAALPESSPVEEETAPSAGSLKMTSRGKLDRECRRTNQWGRKWIHLVHGGGCWAAALLWCRRRTWLLGNVVISKKFLRTRKIMVMT